MLQKIREFAKKNRGAVLVEYVIILAFIGALALAIGLNSDDENSMKKTASKAATTAKSQIVDALNQK